MKWFKHYTDSLDDPFIEELMDEFSHLGYVAWFGLIEIIGKENGHNLTGKLEIKPSFLKRKLRSSPTKLREVFEYCQSNGRLLADCSGEKWKFDFPKIAEIKDNYTKDLQATGKKLSKHKEKEKEKEKEKNKTFSSESVEFRLAKLLLNEMKSNNPECKDPNLQTWAKHIDYMIRIDKRKPGDIAKVIRWCQQDSFWLLNIQSTNKLRYQYDKLYLKMNSDTKTADSGEERVPNYGKVVHK